MKVTLPTSIRKNPDTFVTDVLPVWLSENISGTENLVMSSLFFIIRLLPPNAFVLPYALCTLLFYSSFFRTRVTVCDIFYTICSPILSAFRFRLSGYQSAFANRQSYCRNLFSKLYTPTLLFLPLQATESKMQIN